MEDSLPADPSGSHGCLLGAKCRAQGLCFGADLQATYIHTMNPLPESPGPPGTNSHEKQRVTDTYREKANQKQSESEKHPHEKQD